MEGPSIFLAAEQLAPFLGKRVVTVEGNTQIGKERLINKKILAIIPFGKQLFFQFDTFALRVHFLLFGSFKATINEKKVTGDYRKKVRIPRLSLQFKNGHIEMYSCSLRFIDSANVKDQCDFTLDTMSQEWSSENALKKLKRFPEMEIGDALLDQTFFAGVGNIIKNEVLFMAKISPVHRIQDLSTRKLNEIIKFIHSYVFQFYEWRKKFELKKHYQIYHKKQCTRCGTNIIKKLTGIRKRFSYICPQCEK